MKKYLFVILAFLTGICVSYAKNVTAEKAKKAGISFYYERINRVQNTDYSMLRVTNTFTETLNNSPVYYAFNFTGGGFIIVSADDAVTPVLAYSFEGEYSLDNRPPQFIAWMEGYAKQIDDSRTRQLAPEPGVTETWQHLMTNDVSKLTLLKDARDVAPLLISTWDQGANYNNLCPADPAGPGGHVWAGCVATAMCQLMYYYRYPQTGAGQHCYTPSGYPEQCADFGNTTYKWNEMLNSHSFADTATEILLWHAGISVDMMYSPGGSGAYSEDAAAAFRNNFRYNPGTELLYKDSFTEPQWDSILMYNLDNKHPLYYHGFGTGGHAFNVDGYQGTDYFHFNWGWSGAYNGFYYLNNLNPGGENFNYGQGAIVNCYPDNTANTYPYYCSGPTVLNTLVGTLEDGSGPEEYLDNANCNWLIAPEGPSDSVTSIKITFNKFSTEEGSDVVSIYQGNTATSLPVASFSGDILPDAVTIEGNQALVTFTTNGNTTKPGWFATYTTHSMDWCKAPVTYTDPEGTFTDGSFHFNYKNHANCRWIIEPSDTGAVVLDFTSFRTQEGHDFVKIFDLETSTLLASFSGIYDSANLPAPVVATSGKMFVIFISDGSSTEQGWEAHYKNIHVGIDDISLIPDIFIYPNPASDYLFIRLPDMKIGNLFAELVGTDGRTVLTETFTGIAGNEVKKLNIEGIPAGIYVLRLISEKNLVTKKLIIE